MCSPFLGCSGAENAKHATNQISASPPAPSQNDPYVLHHIHQQQRKIFKHYVTSENTIPITIKIIKVGIGWLVLI